MDIQIWYAIFSTIFGGIYGAFRRLGEVGQIYYFSSLLELIEICVMCHPASKIESGGEDV